jgi:hypothetical protein
MEIEKQIFTNVAARYEAMLKKFRPCKPGSSLLEQNLITILSHEFLTAYPDGIAFSEIPFKKDKKDEENDKWSSRIDGYLATEEIAYLVEAKGDLRKDDFFNAINFDLERICSTNLEESFKNMAMNTSGTKNNGDRNYEIPADIRGLIIANTWDKRTKDEWLEKTFFQTSQNEVQLKAHVFSAGKYGEDKKHELFILIGVTTKNVWIR